MTEDPERPLRRLEYETHDPTRYRLVDLRTGVAYKPVRKEHAGRNDINYEWVIDNHFLITPNRPPR